MPDVSSVRAIKAQLTTELESLRALGALRFSGGAEFRQALEQNGRLVGQALKGGNPQKLQEALQALEAAWKLVPPAAYCTNCLKTIEDNTAAVRKAGEWPEAVSDSVLTASVPQAPRKPAQGFGPAVAAALKLVPKSQQGLLAAFDQRLSLDVLHQIQQETRPLKNLEQVLLRRSKRGAVNLGQLSADDPELKRVVEQFDPNCASAWLLAALSLRAHEPVNQRRFMEQVREYINLASDPEARREAAMREYFLMTGSYGREKSVGGGLVPVGHRAGCMEGAFIDSFPFAVQYSPREEAFYLRTPYASLGLEQYNWKEQGSGPVNSSPRHVRCATFATLQEVLPLVMKKHGDLLKQLGSHGSVTELQFARMVGEISRSDPRYLPEFIRAWESYTSPKAVVVEVCQAAGVFNPKKAVQKLQVLFSSAKDVPEYKRAEEGAEEASVPSGKPPAAQQVGRVAFRSAAGPRMTTGRVLRVIGPAGHAFWIGEEGWESFTKYWAPERAEELSPKGVIARQARKITDVLKRFKIGEEAAPETAAGAGEPSVMDSLLIQQRLALLQDINDEIRTRLGDLSAVTPGPQPSGLLASASQNYALRFQDAEGFPEWMAANLERLPDDFTRDWERLMRGEVATEEDEARAIIARAFRFYDADQLSNRDAALGPVRIDLDWFKNLPEGHPLKERLAAKVGAAQELFAAVRDITDAQGPISADHVEQAYARAGILQLRKEAAAMLLGLPEEARQDEDLRRKWRGCVSFTSSEVKAALAYFSPIFSRRREGEEETLLQTFKRSKDGLVVGQGDFRNIREAVLAFWFNPDDIRAHKAKPIAELIDAITGLVKSYRAVKNLDAILEEARQAGSLPEYDPKNVGDKLDGVLKDKRFKYRLCSGAKVWPAERFEAELVPVDPERPDAQKKYRRGITLYEAVHRLQSRGRLGSGIPWASVMAEGAMQFGLYSEAQTEGRDKALETLYQEALKFTPIDEPQLQKKLSDLKRVREHALTYNKGVPYIAYVSADNIERTPYLDQQEIAVLSRLVSHAEELDQAAKRLARDPATLKAHIEKVFGADEGFRFIDGGLIKPRGASKEQPHAISSSVKDLTLGGTPAVPVVITKEGGLECYNPDILSQALRHYETNYTTVAAEWVERARQVMSPASMQALRDAGYGYANESCQRVFQELDLSKTRVQKSLVAIVNRVYDEMQNRQQAQAALAPTGRSIPFIGWNSPDQPVLNFGRFRGQALLDVATQHPEEIDSLATLNVAKLKRVSEETYGPFRRVMLRIRDRHLKAEPHPGPGKSHKIFVDQQGFIDWLRRGAPQQ